MAYSTTLRAAREPTQHIGVGRPRRCRGEDDDPGFLNLKPLWRKGDGDIIAEAGHQVLNALLAEVDLQAVGCQLLACLEVEQAIEVVAGELVQLWLNSLDAAGCRVLLELLNAPLRVGGGHGNIYGPCVVWL